MSAGWREAMEAVVARTKHTRFRVLCADDHPDHEAWRRRMIELATGEPAPALSVDYTPATPGPCGGCP